MKILSPWMLNYCRICQGKASASFEAQSVESSSKMMSLHATVDSPLTRQLFPLTFCSTCNLYNTRSDGLRHRQLHSQKLRTRQGNIACELTTVVYTRTIEQLSVFRTSPYLQCRPPEYRSGAQRSIIGLCQGNSSMARSFAVLNHDGADKPALRDFRLRLENSHSIVRQRSCHIPKRGHLKADSQSRKRASTAWKKLQKYFDRNQSWQFSVADGICVG